MRVTPSNSADHKQVTFSDMEAVKLIVDASCNVCGWKGRIVLWSTTPEAIDACETLCPQCGEVDYSIQFKADNSKWIGVKGGIA